MDVFLFDLLQSSISSEEQIASFSKLFSLCRFEKDEIIIHEEESNYRLGFLKNGVLRAFVADYDGNEANVRFIRTGDIVSGSFAFDTPSPVTIQALNNSEIYFAAWRELQPFLKRNPEFLKFLTTYLAQGSQKTTMLLSNFIRLNAESRYKIFAKEYPELLESIPHYHIANFLGITPVQLSRIRHKLQK